MGNRLSRIVTRTGDDGTTSLGDGSRVPKDAPRIEALGAVDELNSLIGVLIALPAIAQAGYGQAAGAGGEPAAAGWLGQVQHDLFDIGAELAVPGLVRIDAARIDALEGLIETLNATLPPLKEFVLPGGSPAAALCHLARTVCRRAERRCWALAHAEAVAPGTAEVPAAAGINDASLRYLNRLSDLLFVQARICARADGATEVLWRNRPRGA